MSVMVTMGVHNNSIKEIGEHLTSNKIEHNFGANMGGYTYLYITMDTNTKYDPSLEARKISDKHEEQAKIGNKLRRFFGNLYKNSFLVKHS